MERALVIPAAGLGTRLGAAVPKALVPVAGRPMLEHVIELHRSTVDRIVVVTSPSGLAAFAAFLRRRELPVDLAVQHEPTGMLDAIELARPVVAACRPRRVAITWCDQVALTRETVSLVASRARAAGAEAMILPTIVMDDPYIHFDRDANGRITRVRQRREGDEMPGRGETDMGLFDLSLSAYMDDLRAFSAHAGAAPGSGERNFLPFVAWLAARRTVATVAGRLPIEAMGVNTPDDLIAVQAHLASGSSRAAR